MKINQEKTSMLHLLKQITKYLLSLLICLAIIFITVEVKAEDEIEGYWKSIDDETNEVSGYWNFKVKENILYGYLVSYPDMKPGDVCEKCDGEFKNKPQIGTPWAMLKKKNTKGEWEDGCIIDSGEGKKYKAKMWVKDGKLMVRGYIAFFYETQTWLRSSKDEAEKGS